MPGAGMFSPGPLLLYTVFRNSSTAYFLGSCVTAPKPVQEFFEIPVMNDIGGRSAAFQIVQDGSEWKIFATLNSFDLNILRSIRALGNGLTQPGPVGPQPLSALGLESPIARGSLVLGISDFSLIIVNSYGGTTSAGLPLTAAVDLANARGFSSTRIVGYEEDTEGTRVLACACAFKCRNLFNPVTRGFSLYTEGTPNNLGPLS